AYGNLELCCLRSRERVGAYAAGRRSLHGIDRVAALSRTGRVIARRAAPQIRLDIALHRRITGHLAVLERPLLLGTVKLAPVVDAGVHLRRCARADEVRDSNRS